MADSGTIKIDADAQRYIDECAKAKRATKEVGDGWKDVANHLDASVGKVTKTHIAVVALGAAVAAVEKGYERWTQRIAEAAAASGKVQAAISSGTGHVSPYLRRRLADMQSPLSFEERAGVAGAYRAKRPQAHDYEVEYAAQQASDAAVAGFDARRFTGIQADLAGFGEQSGDLAAALMHRGGSQAEAMAGLMRDMHKNLGGASARNALPLLTGAAAVPGGVDLVGRAWHQYLGQGGTGDFAAAFASRGGSLVPDLADRATLAAVQGSAATGLASATGYLEHRRGYALRDPYHAGEMITKTMEATKDVANAQENAVSGFKRAAADTLADTMSDRTWMRWFPGRPRFMATASASLHVTDAYDDPVLRQQGQAYREVDGMDGRTADLLETQNELIRRQTKPPVPGYLAGQGE